MQTIKTVLSELANLLTWGLIGAGACAFILGAAAVIDAVRG